MEPALIVNTIDSAVPSCLVQKYEVSGNENAPVLITATSPAAWRHVLMNGHYAFRGAGQAVDLDAIINGLRPGTI